MPNIMPDIIRIPLDHPWVLQGTIAAEKMITDGDQGPEMTESALREQRNYDEHYVLFWLEESKKQVEEQLNAEAGTSQLAATKEKLGN